MTHPLIPDHDDVVTRDPNPSLEFGMDEYPSDGSDKNPVVKCNQCESYFYEEAGSKHDYEHLQLMTNIDGQFKGCGNCRTDSFLMDVTKEDSEEQVV